MQIIEATYEILIKNKETLIDFFEDVLKENNMDISKKNDIYNDMLNYYKDGTAILFVAVENQKVQGLIWAYKLNLKGEKRAHINYFIVDSEVRGNGIGKELINKLYTKLKDEGVQKVELMVTAANKNAINFYEKQQFEVERVKLCKQL